MCGFVRDMMSLSVVRSNNLVLCGSGYKEGYILQIPDLEDGAVMAIPALWRG